MRMPIGVDCSTRSGTTATKKLRKKTRFLRMLCFKQGERTFLISKGSPLRLVRLRRELQARAKWGICNAEPSLRSACHLDLLNLTPNQFPRRARRSNCRRRQAAAERGDWEPAGGSSFDANP